jgi:hypothetical protein
MTMNMIVCEVDQPWACMKKFVELVVSRRSLVKETRDRLVPQRNTTMWSVKASRRNSSREFLHLLGSRDLRT